VVRGASRRRKKPVAAGGVHGFAATFAATLLAPVAFPQDMSVDRLLRWADEHLMYEVDTLVYATLQLGERTEKRSARENTLLDSFAIHARCLNDFLWHDRNDKKPRDAFATDFCAPGDWQSVRDGLPQAALEDVRKRRRFGREVMHLTYDRIDGEGEEKLWPCGRVLLEITGALREFATMALARRLGEKTREALLELYGALGTAGGGDPPEGPIGRISVATGLMPSQIRDVIGATTYIGEIQAGGER